MLVEPRCVDSSLAGPLLRGGIIWSRLFPVESWPVSGEVANMCEYTSWGYISGLILEDG